MKSRQFLKIIFKRDRQGYYVTISLSYLIKEEMKAYDLASVIVL
jgi:hypothetical protein